MRRILAAIAAHNPHTMLLPKVETPAQVGRAAEVLQRLAGEDAAFLMPILESPLGIHRAFEIAAADSSVVALTLGLEDLSAELAAPRTAEGWESFLARQTTVYAARAAGVQPIASVFSDISDEDGLAAYVQRERGLGFRWHRLHPPTADSGGPPRNDAIGEAEVERAVRMVRAAREAEKRWPGSGSGGLEDGRPAGGPAGRTDRGARCCRRVLVGEGLGRFLNEE